MSKVKDRQEFVAVLATEFNLSTWKAQRVSADLIRYNNALHRINERNCSVEMSDEVQAKQDKREERIEKIVGEIADELSTSIHVQGDPRGPALKVVLPSGRSNSWGGVGFCVP